MMKIDNEVSRQVLGATPARVFAFLIAISTWRSIRRTLAAHGFTKEEGQRGWVLLRRCMDLGFDEAFDPDVDSSARDASEELAQATGTIFRTCTVALDRLHPELSDFVFSGFEPASGAEAVLIIERFLDRLDELESGEDRAATRESDHAALATLAARGITPAERARMRELIRSAMNLDVALEETNEEERVAALTELRAWFVDWASTAREHIARRDQLVRLGLAKRRSSPQEGDEPDTPVIEPQPTGAPVALPVPSVAAPTTPLLPAASFVQPQPATPPGPAVSTVSPG